MCIAEKVKGSLARASWIRKMFEAGTALKARLGPENVFDFTLGNPDVPPPPEVDATLAAIAGEDIALKHGYMPNAGYLETRQAVAAAIGEDQGVDVPPEAVVMTCGAGGALNVILKTILDPGDAVLVPRPYFVEYDFYADNHGGTLVTAPAGPGFTLDVEALAGAITAATRAVLINSPNNPTGAVYPEDAIAALGALLRAKSKEFGRTIYLVADEPYRKIVYDGARVPPIFPHYEHSLLANSWSKELSLAGERIGYCALNPRAADFQTIAAGLVFCNRVLGYVNAPGLMQRLVARLRGVTVNVDVYRAKRDALYGGLIEAGFKVAKPQGAFYLFPESPIPDDVAFVRELQDANILAVPGSGFGGPGHFRLAYCVHDATIARSLPVFARIGARYRGRA
ncbi:MAG TPA: pyridoxal phosphate-dependent aminotransferase [Planctomycetes bacterium]|nr:pyridoxal phosphate-dependent aminotransferase [Planctomycetota bacterium]